MRGRELRPGLDRFAIPPSPVALRTPPGLLVGAAAASSYWCRRELNVPMGAGGGAWATVAGAGMVSAVFSWGSSGLILRFQTKTRLFVLDL